mmetsp:Transcript_15227/g.21383  ORF Transcript_15227/g.21383 Transcript_15227/m.21383 type:complete len:144 (+) Transcript_15227:92-523(+)|eukprot:CAMPEP_0184487438 /NCGR_PEP_ID=MMETSP0113_2-20130426/10099_1 /TAXON_ID=91329 /ORGANISM="Norrisiella sphaerica, Strain BC52" /LENGTH=143 /DNA_ID=CAMNT_0026869759 /DNA_START=93 /DNA_END=524 /DNA_ORIENTATION=+
MLSSLRRASSVITKKRNQRIVFCLPRLRQFNEKKLEQDTTAAKTLPEHLQLDVRRRKALWRCRQRGWVEIDLLMGNWAAEAIPRMTSEELDELETIIAQENPNILNWLLGHEEVPKELDSPTMRSMRKFVIDGRKDWTVGGNQ